MCPSESRIRRRCSVRSVARVAGAEEGRQNNQVNVRFAYHFFRHAVIALSFAWPLAVPRPQVRRPPVRRELIISSEAFKPALASVQAGDTVIWRNTDIVRHTTTSRKPAWDSGKLRSGASFAWVAEKPGVFEYYCATHKGMKGTLTVR